MKSTRTANTEDWIDQPDDACFSEGAAIGPYRIVELLGAGGMGEVYLAEDTGLGRKVGLKRVTQARLEYRLPFTR